MIDSRPVDPRAVATLAEMYLALAGMYLGLAGEFEPSGLEAEVGRLRLVAACALREQAERDAWLAALPPNACTSPPSGALLDAEAATRAALGAQGAPDGDALAARTAAIHALLGYQVLDAHRRLRASRQTFGEISRYHEARAALLDASATDGAIARTAAVVFALNAGELTRARALVAYYCSDPALPAARREGLGALVGGVFAGAAGP